MLLEEPDHLSNRGHLKYEDTTLLSLSIFRRGIPRLITEPAKHFKYLTPTLDYHPAHFESTPFYFLGVFIFWQALWSA